MSEIFYNDSVAYGCACGLVSPLARLYFCRHCLNLRCGFCLCHEVDSHFCFNCLENIPSSEAKHKKYRCHSCFDCPSCRHTLSARGTTVVVTTGAGSKKSADESGKGGDEVAATAAAPSKADTKKMFYLSCLACRWTTRDVGIPDQTVANGSWPEADYIHATRFAQLLDHNQSVVLQEKQEKQELWRRKTPKQHKFPGLGDRTAGGVNVSLVRRQLGWTDKSVAPKVKVAEIKLSEATKADDDLPEDIFTKPISLKRFTTIEQRLANPAGQPYTVNHLFPQHKSLSIKRSLRCRQCEHNIVKPEYNPTSIKYRIQLFASYHIPELRLMRMNGGSRVGIKNGETISIQLQFINPTINDMTISLMELPTIEVEEEEKKELVEELKKCTVAEEGNSSLSLRPNISLQEEPRKGGGRKTNAKFVLPEDATFVVNQRDESTEYDEEVVQKEKGDPKFVVSRKSNKVAIRLDIEPMADVESSKDENVIVGLMVRFSHHVNNSTTTVAAAGAGPLGTVHELNARVYLDLGKVFS